MRRTTSWSGATSSTCRRLAATASSHDRRNGPESDVIARGIMVRHGRRRSTTPFPGPGTLQQRYVRGGSFYLRSSATTLNRIAHGGTASTWVPLGAGLNSNVFALARRTTAPLYAGGSYIPPPTATWTAAASPAGRARSGEGGGATPLSSRIVNAQQRCYNSRLASSSARYPGIASSPNVAKYNGTSYSTLGTGGTDSPVYSLGVFNNTLYVGGNFGHAGGIVCSGLASWNGVSWSAVNLNEGTPLIALSAFGNELEVGNGAFGSEAGWERLTPIPCCGSADFNCDGDLGTDSDIAAFFACLAGACPPPPCTSNADFNGDGDLGTDADIEAFFRVLGGGSC